MKEYISKPKVVQAFKWTGFNEKDVVKFIKTDTIPRIGGENSLLIAQPGNYELTAYPGEMIVYDGINYIPMSEDKFKQDFELL